MYYYRWDIFTKKNYENNGNGSFTVHKKNKNYDPQNKKKSLPFIRYPYIRLYFTPPSTLSAEFVDNIVWRKLGNVAEIQEGLEWEEFKKVCEGVAKEVAKKEGI